MAFTLDGIIFDRIQLGVMEDFDGNILGFLPQLSTATIETSAESKDATDKDGTLIKRFYNAKSATITATNQIISMDALGQLYGSGKDVANEDDATHFPPIVMPKIVTVKQGVLTLDVEGVVMDDTTPEITVTGMSNAGSKGAVYTLGTSESATEFKYDSATHTLTLPTDTDAEQFLVKYNRSVKNGASITNKADKFPGTIRLTLKALAVDPCSADTVRACYIYFPSLQLDPSTSMEISTEATFDLTGNAQVDYCSADKALFIICMADDVEE